MSVYEQERMTASDSIPQSSLEFTAVGSLSASRNCSFKICRGGRGTSCLLLICVEKSLMAEVSLLWLYKWWLMSQICVRIKQKSRLRAQNEERLYSLTL